MTKVTQILNAMEQGDVQATDALLPLVYEELRHLAMHKLAQEKSGQTLQPTALVHEAYLRLVGGECQNWNSRNHFFMAAAESMRRILVENARRKQRLKHGGGRHRVDFENIDVSMPESPEHILAMNEALNKLAVEDPLKANLVKLRFFAGLRMKEAAELLGISSATADRYWSYARAWLFDEISSD